MSEINSQSFKTGFCIGNYIPLDKEDIEDGNTFTTKIDKWIENYLFVRKDVKCVYMYVQSKEQPSCNFTPASFEYLTNPDLTNAPVTMIPLIEKFFQSCNEGFKEDA